MDRAISDQNALSYFVAVVICGTMVFRLDSREVGLLMERGFLASTYPLHRTPLASTTRPNQPSTQQLLPALKSLALSLLGANLHSRRFSSLRKRILVDPPEWQNEICLSSANVDMLDAKIVIKRGTTTALQHHSFALQSGEQAVASFWVVFLPF